MITNSMTNKMFEIINGHTFHLHNQRISYVLTIMENGQLGHLYYGKSLGALSAADIAYLKTQNSKSAGTVKYSPDTGNFTLADRAQEYPVYGSSDFRRGAIDVSCNQEPWYLDFKFADYSITSDKPRNLKTPESYAIGNEEATQLNIRLVDDQHQLELTEHFTIFDNQSVVVRSTTVKNCTNKPVNIENMMSAVLELPDDKFQMINLSGAWLKERHVKFHNLEQGTVSVESLKGASGHQHNPFIALVRSQNLNQGEVYASNLIYSGNFISQVEVNEWHKTRLMSGLNPTYFGWKLDVNESFKTPEAVMYYSDHGINGLMDVAAGFTKKHVIDRRWRQRDRPIVFNNWEATYYDFDEQKLLKLARQAKRIGMECFVVDDGWFGQRNTDRSSLGDWRVDPRKFPNGIAAFSKKIHAMGLQMGLWFEPEMVSPDTSLYQEHPDWVVRHPYKCVSIGRGQYVLDFANPEVVESVYQQIKPVILAAELDYMKWDMNRNITEAYSPYLTRHNIPQTEFFHRYAQGVNQLYQLILTDFPDMLIEGCAGGGGRFDLGTLFYCPQIWPSDDSDAVERLSILTGTALAYPLSSFSNHVSAAPNDQVGRQTSLGFRQMVANFGPLGYELDISKLPLDELEQIKKNIAFYRRHRQLLVNGRFRQLQSIDPQSNEVTWSVENTDKTEFFVGFYRKLATPNSGVLNYVKLPMVDPNLTYQIDGQEKVSGAVLQHLGLRQPYQFNGANRDTAELYGDFQAHLFHIVSVE